MAEITVVVVAHNNWPELELAVDSALYQSEPPLEVIVVDNGSTDDTARQIAERYGNRVSYVLQDNRLDSGGYNTGIKRARGEFIQLLDGDDCLAPTKLAKQAAVLRARPDLDIVYGDVLAFPGEPGYAMTVEQRRSEQHEDFLLTLCANGGNIPGLIPTSALIRRSVFDRVGLFDEGIYGADYDYWFRAAWAGCGFAYVPGAIMFYRQHARQMSLNETKMARRGDRTLEKAAALIDREPHRSLLLDRLARVRFWRALRLEPTMGAAEAGQLLRSARTASPHAVPAAVYYLGHVAIRVPGARRVLGSRTSRWLSTSVARLVRRS